MHSDSEISYSMSYSKVSVESRSHSCDSTISVKAFEVTRKVRRFSKHTTKKLKSNTLVCKLPSSQKGSAISQESGQVRSNFTISNYSNLYNHSYIIQLGQPFPEDQNVFSPSDSLSQFAPIPSFQRREASAGFDSELEDQMRYIESYSIASLNVVSSRVQYTHFKSVSNSELSEHLMLEDFSKYDKKGMYTSVAIMNTDSEEEKHSDTD